MRDWGIRSGPGLNRSDGVQMEYRHLPDTVIEPDQRPAADLS